MLGYTQKAKKALEMAAKYSRDLGHGYIGSEHLLVGLIEVTDGVAAKVLNENGAIKSAVIELIKQQIAPPASVSIKERDGYSPKAKEILDNSLIEAERF